MQSRPSPEVLQRAFAAFADGQSSLREATVAFQGPNSVYEQHLRVFDVYPLPFDPSQIRFQYPDFQAELTIARSNLQSFSHGIEAGQDAEVVGNGYQTALAIVEVIRAPFYRNMSELPLEHMSTLLNVFHRTRLQLAVLLLENTSTAALTLLNRKIPDLERTLRCLPKDHALTMLASRDIIVRRQLDKIDIKMRGNRAERRTWMMPVASRFTRS